ncbi:TetR/AcrR family transcriptional regulator [Occultella kanbiaonis]|uniref:TetR/AcrR family transcriptional regulator n=1 Tax=Occultella kanbiaonis TaxID=2675754 RepID=UPI001F43CCF9|nr:TetR/AcrR family transcriptional regulator [Occultella kanbiaonis]
MSRATVTTTPAGLQGSDADGRSRRWDAHRAERRAELCHAARRAVHHGGAELSMDEMAAQMGTSKSIVYRYFTDKAGLRSAVGAMVLAEMSGAFEEAAHGAGSPQDRLRAMVGIYVGTLAQSTNVYRFVTRSGDGAPGPDADVSDFLTTLTDYVAAPLREVLTGSTSDPRLADAWAAGVVGFVRGSAESWLALNPVDRLDPDRLVVLISNWLWAGASAPLPGITRISTVPTEEA